MNIKSKQHKADAQYTVYLREVDPDYDQDAGYEVAVAKGMMPPRSREFYTDRKDAEYKFNYLTT